MTHHVYTPAPGGYREALALRINRHAFYGWAMMVVGGMGLLASSPAQSYTFAVFMDPVSAELGLSRTAISSAYALATLAAAFGLTPVGWLMDRFGGRLIITGLTVMLGLASIAFGYIGSLLWLTLGFVAMRFLGQGALMLTCNTLVAQWFNRKRGVALSLSGLGFSAGMAIYPPLTQWAIEQWGWRPTWLWLGLSVWVLMLLPAWLLIHDRPEALGLRPDGDPTPETALPDAPSHRVAAVNAAGNAAGKAEPPSTAAAADDGFTLSEALRHPVFWLMAVALSVPPMLITGVVLHQISIFERQGLSAHVAALVFPVIAVTMVVSMPLLGWMLDRYPTRHMAALALGMMGCTLLSMLLVRDIPTAMLYAVFNGAASGSMVTTGSYVWPAYFGRRALGSIQGAGRTVGILGAALGPLPFGIAYDTLGGYTEALLVLSLLPFAMAMAVLWVRPPVRAEAAPRTTRAEHG